ncbi:hypothetical protein XA68_17974 [Ophiocordyceps unilateralis]|uniref:Uncharacterized protein n=1 Tax=Ophiocordyceps unilateralis TaxID=268505 RepID=A0A2A9PIK6_OPHUN|nr:hypothetical protein XA68_17974 [Ophiocordyceps unilateralis]
MQCQRRANSLSVPSNICRLFAQHGTPWAWIPFSPVHDSFLLRASGKGWPSKASKRAGRPMPGMPDPGQRAGPEQTHRQPSGVLHAPHAPWLVSGECVESVTVSGAW